LATTSVKSIELPCESGSFIKEDEKSEKEQSQSSSSSDSDASSSSDSNESDTSSSDSSSDSDESENEEAEEIVETFHGHKIQIPSDLTKSKRKAVKNMLHIPSSHFRFNAQEEYDEEKEILDANGNPFKSQPKAIYSEVWLESNKISSPEKAVVGVIVEDNELNEIYPPDNVYEDASDDVLPTFPVFPTVPTFPTLPKSTGSSSQLKKAKVPSSEKNYDLLPVVINPEVGMKIAFKVSSS
jgi:hypothetical protein